MIELLGMWVAWILWIVFIAHFFIVGWCLFAMAFLIYDNAYGNIIKNSQRRTLKSDRTKKRGRLRSTKDGDK